jgi:hypothetical protein
MPKTGPCALCARERPLTFHHLIPRTVHSNKWFRRRFSREEMAQGLDLCSDCHSAIHRIIPNEKELARDYRTREALLEHPELATFVTWVSTREGKQRYRTKRPGRRR